MTEERAGYARGVTEEDRIRLGERLREAREYVGLTQDEVAKHLGIPRSALSNIEAGQRKVEVLELRTLAKLYQRPTIWFTGEEATELPALPKEIAHLARAAASLSSQDREQLARFADFLRAKAKVKAGGDGG
ncbi:MAG: helix-turn-helix domain-containing protein [Acetobacteraceae bacterium]|nr:helix-turn-helix domain-containing protein [Acetobacteraceae bacterium]